jgi:FkbM family methyltransferase
MSSLASASIEFSGITRQFHFREQTSDEAVVRMVLVNKQYDLTRLARYAELIAFARRREASGLKPLIVDAGANIGATSLYFCVQYPGAEVVAVEPDRENVDLLNRNVAGLNVEVIRGALSSRPGRARVVDVGRGHWAYRTESIGGAELAPDTIPHVTINDIYASRAAGFFPFIAKIDIEGSERDLFSDNTEWVARTPLIIIELHDWMLPKAGTSAPFLRCISRLDRDFVSRGENVYSFANDLDALAAA